MAQVEVDTATLTPEEWFLLYALQGLKPDAMPYEAVEYRKAALGKTKLEQHLLVRRGVESLMSRGYLAYETDADGQQVLDEAKEPIIKVVGKLITRVIEYKPPKGA